MNQRRNKHALLLIASVFGVLSGVAALAGTADDKQWLEDFVAANGGCAAYPTIFGMNQLRDVKFRVRQGQFNIELFGRSISKWSDDDVEATLKVYRNCQETMHSKWIAVCMTTHRAVSDCEPISPHTLNSLASLSVIFALL
mgnify:CR=1 FL=1